MVELSCPMCQGKEFKDGVLKGHYDIRIVEKDSGLIERKTIFGGNVVNVKICQDCKYLMLFG